MMADVSSEVYRTNKLLEIENLDWENQLKRAVGGFRFDFTFYPNIP